jgi:hypothetical protein
MKNTACSIQAGNELILGIVDMYASWRWMSSSMEVTVSQLKDPIWRDREWGALFLLVADAKRGCRHLHLRAVSPSGSAPVVDVPMTTNAFHAHKRFQKAARIQTLNGRQSHQTWIHSITGEAQPGRPLALKATLLLPTYLNHPHGPDYRGPRSANSCSMPSLSPVKIPSSALLLSNGSSSSPPKSISSPL